MKKDFSEYNVLTTLIVITWQVAVGAWVGRY